jgi:ketosteroid isomerase-like protein
MTARKTYIERFRRGDHDMLLSCLTGNVTWKLLGYKIMYGKIEFDAGIENDATVGELRLAIDRLIEGDVVVALGYGAVRRTEGGHLRFVFSDVFTFAGSASSKLEIYQVHLC